MGNHIKINLFGNFFYITTFLSIYLYLNVMYTNYFMNDVYIFFLYQNILHFLIEDIKHYYF